MTETSPVVLMQERGTVNYASVGSPTPNTDAKIVDLDNNDNVLGPNTVFDLMSNIFFYNIHMYTYCYLPFDLRGFSERLGSKFLEIFINIFKIIFHCSANIFLNH